MPTREQKETTIKELEGIFERAQVAIVTDYRGLTVKEITDLRRRLQKVGGELTVAKNTLVDRVTRENDSWKAIESLLAGPTALAIGFEDPVAAAKVVTDFAKEKRKVEIKVRGGVLEGKTLEMILNELVANYGWEELGRRVRINCFRSDPSIPSSLKFLRRTPWARSEVEELYRDFLWEKEGK